MSNNILVIAEHFRGRLSQISFEILGEGRRLAQELGGQVEVLLLGSSALSLASTMGAAKRVVLVDHPALAEFVPEIHAGIIANYISEAAPRLVLLGSTSAGLDLLGLLSAGTGFPCVDNCTHFELRDGSLLATSQVFGGKLFAEIRLPDQTTLAAVTPGSFSAEAGVSSAVPEVCTLVPLPEELAGRTVFRKIIEPPAGDIDISKSPVLIGVGRGIQNADNLSLANDLAEATGGAVCASRPVIDQGWLPLSRQVGKSGVTVKPKLYLAAGISGAPEHVEGMKGSELIIAINTDAAAPIFSVAHYGVVADALELLPALTEAVKSASAKRAGAS